jgi:hypothetical protein
VFYCHQIGTPSVSREIGLSALGIGSRSWSRCDNRFTESTWWEWTRGSALVFWRWSEYVSLALEGCPPFLLTNLPNFKRRTPTPPASKLSLISAKLRTIIDLGYLIPGRVESLIQFFDVPKADDIRLVYNGRSCGLNKATSAPNFWLPLT